MIADSNFVESELMTFNPPSPVRQSPFLRTSPANVMTGGTQARKPFITITFTDGFPGTCQEKDTSSRLEGSPDTLPSTWESSEPWRFGPEPPSSRQVSGKQDTPAPQLQQDHRKDSLEEGPFTVRQPRSFQCVPMNNIT